MQKTVTVATLQMTSGIDIAENLSCISSILKTVHSKIDLLVLPEMFSKMGTDEFGLDENYNHLEIVNVVSTIAKQLQCWIIGGTIPTPIKNNNKHYARSFIFNRNGDIVDQYDKIHLFDIRLKNISYQESERIIAGRRPVVINTDFGKVGIAICYDIRFPELFHLLVNKGAQIIAIPAAFTKETGRRHWEILLKNRAIETQCYLVAANQYGNHYSNRISYGHSMIIDPHGRTNIFHNNSGLLIDTLDLEALKEYRKSFPIIQQKKRYAVRMNSSVLKRIKNDYQ